MKALIAAAVVVLGTVSQAMAADPASEVVIADPAYNWSGVYVGAQAGYGWGDSTWRLLNSGAGVAHNDDVDPDGALGGVYLGYNHQFANRIVIGAEADIGFSDMKGRVDALYGDALGDVRPNNIGTAELEWTGAIRARVGYAFGRLLPYATAGVAFGEYEFVADYLSTAAIPGKTTQTGWTIGAGAEYAITDHLTTRVDYRYTDLGDESYAVPGFLTNETNVDLTTHELRFGVAYKF